MELIPILLIYTISSRNGRKEKISKLILWGQCYPDTKIKEIKKKEIYKPLFFHQPKQKIPYKNISKRNPVHAMLLQLCPTLCNPINCSPPGSSVHGILQVRILEWVAMPSSRNLTPRGTKNYSPFPSAIYFKDESDSAFQNQWC